MDALVTGLIEPARRHIRGQGVRTVEQVRAQRRRLVSNSPRLARQSRGLKQFLFAHLYSHREVRAEREKIARTVEGLFRYFVAHPRSLPPSYFAQTEREAVHRVVCDYIAGMTDTFILRQHRRLCGAKTPAGQA